MGAINTIGVGQTGTFTVFFERAESTEATAMAKLLRFSSPLAMQSVSPSDKVDQVILFIFDTTGGEGPNLSLELERGIIRPLAKQAPSQSSSRGQSRLKPQPRRSS